MNIIIPMKVLQPASCQPYFLLRIKEVHVETHFLLRIKEVHVEGQSTWNTGYHWEEKDHSSWAKNRIGELIKTTTTVKKGLTIEYTEVKVEGHATLNMRKGQKLVGYELNVHVPWKGDA